MKNVANAGRTVIFVSHNLQTITGLTDRAILLGTGQLKLDGKSSEVVEHFLHAESDHNLSFTSDFSGSKPEITSVKLKTSLPGNVHQIGEPMEIYIEITTPEPIENSNVSFQIMSDNNQPVVHLLNLDSELPMLRQGGVQKLTCRIPNLRLFPGHYSFAFYMGASHPRRIFETPSGICSFEVVQLKEVREFYWRSGSALYLENAIWSSADSKSSDN
jgi:lipopolysaccharide transport system ATP-binding protein